MSVFASGDLLMAMSSMQRSSFDFVGRYAAEDADCFYLDNALVINYDDEKSMIGLAPLHLPIGCLNVKGTTLAVAKIALAYTVRVGSGEDWIAKEYEKFFGGDKG